MSSWLITLTVLLALPAKATTLLSSEEKIIPVASITEDRYGLLPVKGNAVVGGLADGGSGSVGSTLPKIYLPSGLSGKLCLHIASQDGTFSASAEYQPGNLAAGIYSLAFRSSHPQFRKFNVEKLAALVQVENDCSSSHSEVKTILPVFWAASGPAFPIHLLLQTDQGDARLLPSDNSASITCNQIKNGSSSVFDQECLITPAWKEALRTQLVVDIRDAEGNHFEPISITIIVP